ncbi:MAG: hypothetical protein Q8M15_16330 [Bacteroidota bacterium]|nr:hypothetical protein [Bacteroidota bacterium]
MKSFLKNISGINKTSLYVKEELEKIKVLMSQPMVQNIIQLKTPVRSFKEIEFSAFSQWGDDGIIQYLIEKLEINNETFIEFGVSNYLESNTRFLLLNNNWRGLVLDGSKSNIDYILNDTISWKFDITAKHLFITKSNINQTLIANGFEGEIGILHIDIDGNDYWLWDSIEVVNAKIVIMEYNSVFGNKAAISVPYQDDFFVSDAHFSNLYFGASLKAMCHLAKLKGYSFVGSNSHGNNAYFVQTHLLNEWVQLKTADEGYINCNFRQNRDKDGKFTLKRDEEMIHQCGDLDVIDVISNIKSPLKNFL